MEGLGADEAELLEGEVDMDDDAFVEEEPDEVQAPPPVPWRLMARYLGQSLPSAETLKEHVTKVWRLRQGANFAPIKPKWFIITLFSEGDYNFVTEGGPWIHLGNTFIVQPLKGDARPSETDLSTVPIRVHMYDVPWDKQNDANGRKWGAKLGKVMEVDADASGAKFKDYLRVRIEIPINRRLQTKITTGVKGRPETHSTYILRLRESSLFMFQHRQAYAPPADHPIAKRGLDFSSSADNSATLGKPKSREKKRHVYQRVEHVVPVAVDARDGFERREATGDQRVDMDLTERITAFQVKYPKETLTEIRERMWKQMEPYADNDDMPTLQDIVPNKLATIFVPPLAVLQRPFPLWSSEMILALRGLSTLGELEECSDTSMPEVSSVLGKRLASHKEEEDEVEGRNKALIVHEQNDVRTTQKRGKVKPIDNGASQAGPMEGVEFLEAASHGAAGQLMGTRVAPRQEQ
ncbi:hypothetical protein ACQ4PT_049973 [Festuca glaucescens]